MKHSKLNKYSFIITTFVTLGTAAFVAQGCGSSTNAGSNPINYIGTASPGDVWNFTIDRPAGTFSGTSDGGHPGVTTSQVTVSGSLTSFANGFLKLTVTTSSSNSGITVDGTHNIAYALEVPTVALIVQPANGGPVITSIYNGGCGALSGAGFNYVRAGFGNKTYNVGTADAYGSATMNGNSSAPQITGGSSNSITGTSLGFTPPGTGSCSNGTITFPGGITGIVTTASGGIMILDQGAGKGGIVVFGGNSLGAADVASKTFNGLIFKNNSSSTQAIKVVFNASSVGTVYSYTSVDNNTVGAATNLIKNITGSGAIAGNAFDADGVSHSSVFHAIMQATSDSSNGTGHTILFGVAEDGGSTAPSNFLLVQQNPAI